jgi:hypothetical protein
MQQIIGPLSAPPSGTDPKSGEVSCSYTPAKGPSFVEVTLHDGDLIAWKKRNGGKSPSRYRNSEPTLSSIPTFRTGGLVCEEGAFILRVTMPKGAQSIEAVKAIARKALTRL